MISEETPAILVDGGDQEAGETKEVIVPIDPEATGAQGAKI